MTTPAPRNDTARVPARKQRPEGWPVGSFDTYAEAQAAVDMLSDAEFPVNDLTIVGVDLMEVEQVMGRLTWGRVILGGAASGAWMGVFFGVLMGLFSQNWIAPLIAGIFMGVIFGIVSAAVPYAMSKGTRDFSSTTHIVAGRYDVLCSPTTARRARDMIAQRYSGPKPQPRDSYTEQPSERPAERPVDQPAERTTEQPRHDYRAEPQSNEPGDRPAV